MNYSETFLNFIEKNRLIKKNDKILVAFSGGKDSVTLAHLLLRNNYDFSLAHLNHNLRGEESERDMNFCIEFAKKYNLQIFTRTVNIKKISIHRKKSIEETGREERYRFLNEIAEDYGFSKIATAHHLDDQVETFFINFFRKKSIFALQGIKLKYGKIVRPLLCFTKNDIEEYIKKENLPYVEDSSNFDTNFLRNKIRHILIPFLEKEFSVDLNSIIKFYQGKIKEIEEVLNFIIQDIFEKAIFVSRDTVKINKKKLPKFWDFDFIRFEIYKNILTILNLSYSKNFLTEIDKFIKTEKETGKFYVDFLKIFKEYGIIIFTKDEVGWKKEELKINEPGEYTFLDYKIILKIIPKDEINFKEEDAIFLDYDKIKFPIKVRFYREGDRFIPLGMNDYVKLKDFFINQKIPFRIRRNLFIFEDANSEIISVYTIRISEKFKIDNSTKKVLKIKILLN